MSFVKLTEDWIKLTDKKGISYVEVILLCKIASLSNNKDNKDKACKASNAYFASLLCTTERNIQRYLKSLKSAKVIKTFEKKQGMKTTTRYIYPQYNIIEDMINEYNEKHDIAHDNFGISDDNIDICSEVAHDNFGSSTRQFMSEDTTDLVKGHDNVVTLIREEKRKEEKRDSVADAPQFASLNTANAVSNKWTPKDNESKDIFGSDYHSDVNVIRFINEEWECMWGEKTPEKIASCVWATQTNTNTDKIIEYINEVLMNKGA